MASFAYHALAPSGKLLTGQMEAESTAEVLTRLDQIGFTPISAKIYANQNSGGLRALLTPEPPPNEITSMTLDLSMLLKGGVALDEALAILGQLAGKRWLARMLRDLQTSLSEGKSLSQSVAKYPRLFPPIYVKMVEVAEAAGSLEETLSSLAAERQRGEGMRKRFVSAVSYPLFLIVAATAVLCFVLVYLIPKFEIALQGFRDKIDPATLFVFNLSAALNRNYEWVILAVAVVFGTGLLAVRIGRERGLWIRLLAHLPGARSVLTHEFIVTFCRTLAILVRSDVDISSALRLIRGVVRLPEARREIDAITAEVRQGKRLSETLSRRDLFPRHVVQMLRVGEEAGELAESASRVAAFYEAKLETALGRAIAIVGPAVMIVVSILIAWLIISVMTALMSINDVLM